MSPLHFQGEFTKNVIYDYKCSSTTARDFQCSRTQSRDFYAQAHKQETSNGQEHNQETSMLMHTSKRLLIKHNYKEKCLTLNT